ncbi:unnamed protein product, partial [Owenia fusiformis]
AKGLFNKVIGQSGSVAFAEVVKPPEIQIASVKALATLTGCESENTDEVLDCLRTKPYMDLVKPAPLKEDDPPPILMWTPISGDSFFPKHPMELLEDEDTHKQLKGIKFIFGVNDIEAYMLTKADLFMRTFSSEKTLTNLKNDVQMLLMMFLHTPPPSEDNKAMYDGIIDALLDHYLKVSDPTEEDLIVTAARIGGGILLQAPPIRTANKFREIGADVKFYVLNKGPSHFMNFRPSFIETDHGDDLFFCFGLSHTINSEPMFSNVTWNEEDIRMEDLFVNYWLNFAKTGDPNGPNL